MYAQQDRFTNGGDFARYAAAAGFDAIEISHSTNEAKLRQLLEADVLPVTSVHQPAPWKRHRDGRASPDCNIASLVAEERRAGISYATDSIAWAARIGADRVVVHLGQVTDLPGMFPEEREMRRMFDADRTGEPRFGELRELAISRRMAAAEPYVEAARLSLLEIIQAAEPTGVRIGLENRYHFHEIPLPDEYDRILDGIDPAQAGYWHDTGHAEVLHRLGFVDRSAWFAANSARTIGAHLHDVVGIGDHRAPGDGDVDWSYIAAGLGHLSSYTLEINQHQSDALVAGAPAFLSSVGLR